jgi:predicted Kef-type K+ transport protein
MGLAQLGATFGLSHEIGAFIAGVLLATSPIALYIADNLRPLRDFFLVIFFFTLGASFNLTILTHVLVPASVLAALVLTIKPLVFRMLLRHSGEALHRAREVGVRLGQISEFSLLIAVLALQLGVISRRASYLIQVSTLLTFIVSSYIIVMHYPTPIAISDRLRRD